MDEQLKERCKKSNARSTRGWRRKAFLVPLVALVKRSISNLRLCIVKIKRSNKLRLKGC